MPTTSATLKLAATMPGRKQAKSKETQSALASGLLIRISRRTLDRNELGNSGIVIRRYPANSSSKSGLFMFYVTR